ncbi:probable serine/threonine-protein kinase PBL11 [Cornus florida]|uniref:probable serine/threonine-protein kinase PBL11 n=1 Tax=Cornus florida TaxID=4283 RepID=UPI002898712A|nr:probable serine/threonine-protein kinase PBL11 [Cornus florida]
MANCCFRKKRKDPNQSVAIAKPSTGVNDPHISRGWKTSKPLHEITSSLSSHKGVNEAVFFYSGKKLKPLQEKNSHVSSNTHIAVTEYQNSLPRRTSNPLQDVLSNAQKEKLRQEERDDIYNVSNGRKQEDVLCSYKLNHFCYCVLKIATQKFCEKNIIGQGGFGDVYKGWIDKCTMNAAKPGTGTPIAVKKLRNEGSQGCDDWLNELNVLSRLNHPNVVKLLGFCCEDKHRIIVYEYMTKKSLERHLSKAGNGELNWSRRIKIALGSARGLEYLHTSAKPVIHRDIKSSNILLDNAFNAKLSDFGLAKFGSQGSDTPIVTRILGTQGYFAPEYVGTGRLTLKTDVYSFGVVLLEILSGSGAVKRYSNGKTGDLAKFAIPLLDNKEGVCRVIDKRLGRNQRIKEACEFAQIILQCLCLDPQCRPTMTEVVLALEKLEQKI